MCKRLSYQFHCRGETVSQLAGHKDFNFPKTLSSLCNKMDFRNKTKTIIRSLLISSPKSLTMHDLDSDYLKYEGHGIPFARLGYPNLKQFLSSIPDILNVSL